MFEKFASLFMLGISLQVLSFVCAIKMNDLKVCLPNLGCLQGIHVQGHRKESYEAFMGVPFAEPPLGELRFKNPEPIAPWNGVLNAKEPKPFCLQKNYLVTSWPVTGEEDCLYLNLYRPVRRSHRKLPVMFYIHGGGFFMGAVHPALYGPEYFMDTREVILVAAAYRLGPFGDQNIPGNMGLKDQRLALKWLQENVEYFGGDPNTVTIFGHSAGASSVHFHMLSPASKGLFQRAIIMSGSALGPYVNVLEQPLEQAIKLAEVSGIANAADMSSTDLTAALRTIDGQTLLKAGDSFKFWHVNPLINYHPVIEDATWPDAFLVESPADTVKKEGTYNIPWMIGLQPVEGEGSIITLGIITNETLRQEMNQNFENYMEQLMEFSRSATASAKSTAIKWIIEEYFHGMHEVNESTAKGFRELFGDMQFYHPYYRTVRSYLDFRSETQTNPLYLYKFSYRGPDSFSEIFTGGSNRDYGAVHLDDILYLFKAQGLFPTPYKQGSGSAKLVRDYVRMYVVFAKTGYSHNFDRTKPCTKELFRKDDNASSCDYIEFSNDKDGYNKVERNEFNVRRMQLWDKIMELVN